MSKPLNLLIVEHARSLIANERHWCRGDVALDEDGNAVCPTSGCVVRRCALGAVIAAGYELTHDLNKANELAFQVLRPHYSTSTLVRVNDMRGHAAVLALFDEIIKAEKL